MKFLLTAAFAVFVLLTGSNADATFANVMDVAGCRYTVTSDTGTSKYGVHQEGCRCRDTTCYRTTVLTSCGGTYETEMGTTISGAKCCADMDSVPQCLNAADNVVEEQIQSANSPEIGEIFAPLSPVQTTAYYGYVGTANRSPNLGRGNSRLAKLDVCLGATDTDTALSGGNVSSCQQYCGSTNYNDYCSQNSAAVCNDRCECALNDPGCNNL